MDDAGARSHGQHIAALTGAPVVIEDIEHGEEPAEIPEHEAGQISNQQWATYVERLLARGHMDPDQTPGVVKHGKKCVLLEFSRHPQELEDALLMSSVADGARRQGIEVQPDWAQGAKIF